MGRLLLAMLLLSRMVARHSPQRGDFSWIRFVAHGTDQLRVGPEPKRLAIPTVPMYRPTAESLHRYAPAPRFEDEGIPRPSTRRATLGNPFSSGVHNT